MRLQEIEKAEMTTNKKNDKSLRRAHIYGKYANETARYSALKKNKTI